MAQHFDAEGLWWTLPRGPRNAITDVAGVTVGHATLTEGSACTGVTAILPHDRDLYRARVVAGAEVLNGFGKSSGLMQLVELGEIESPIVLTNTLAVPACAAALTAMAIEANPRIGRREPSLNPLVMECNDGYLNDIQTVAVTEADVRAAVAAAGADFAQGSVGAGTGMRSFGLAGGIGSASRIVPMETGPDYRLGVLVQSNFGVRSELRILGQRPFPPQRGGAADKGSVIVVMATDAPLCSRQLTRLARRAAPGLGRTGGFMAHGSGDVAVAFTTANRIETGARAPVDAIMRLAEPLLDGFFLAAVEATEEAVLNALWHGQTRPGYDGTLLPTLRDLLK